MLQKMFGPTVFLSFALLAGALPPTGSLAGTAKTAQGTPAKSDSKAAAPAAPSSPPASAWTVTCTDRVGGKFICEMTQTIVEQKSRRQVLLISVKHGQGNVGHAMLFRLPHGVYIPAGVTVKVDGGKASKLEFQKSDQYGIYAALPLPDDLIATLKKGKELDISTELNKGQAFNLKGQLTGFAPAFEKITTLD